MHRSVSLGQRPYRIFQWPVADLDPSGRVLPHPPEAVPRFSASLRDIEPFIQTRRNAAKHAAITSSEWFDHPADDVERNTSCFMPNNARSFDESRGGDSEIFVRRVQTDENAARVFSSSVTGMVCRGCDGRHRSELNIQRRW